MSQFISLQDAVTMTSSYRQNKEAILSNSYKNQNILAVCETFDKNYIDSVLGQTDCQKLRVYYGMDTDSKVHAIIVGVDSNGNDILPKGSTDAYIVEQGERCPADCPPSSALNS
jgi:hypothetical protein